MNELLKTLYKNAKDDVRSDEEIEGVAYDNFEQEVLNTFAKMIVKECANLCNSDDAARILKHFKG